MNQQQNAISLARIFMALYFVKSGFAYDVPEITCAMKKSANEYVQLTCKLKNTTNFNFAEIKLGQDENGDNGSLKGDAPKNISMPNGWVSQLYYEEESDNYGYFWNALKSGDDIRQGDSICCFKLTIKSSDIQQYTTAPLEISDRIGNSIWTHFKLK